MAERFIAPRAVIRADGRAAKLRTRGLRLFDDVGLQHQLVADFLAAPGAALDRPAPRSAGVYALRYGGGHPAYQRLGPGSFIYIGKAALLPERISSHRQSIGEARDLEVADFEVVLVALQSIVHAEVAERLLIGAFDPIWCRYECSGFGSRPQGAGRSGQRPTRWDRRHPGRLDRNQRLVDSKPLGADHRRPT